jgi:hypothetical protein
MVKNNTRKHKTRGGLEVKAVFEPTLTDCGHLRVIINGQNIITVGNIKRSDYRFNRQLLRVERDGLIFKFTNINLDALDNLLNCIQ